MPGAGIRGRRTRAQWQALVGAYETGGVSQRAFCAQHGIAISTLRHWRARLGDGMGAADAARTPGARLIPVRILDAPGVGSGVVVVGGGGVRIEVAAGFDGATLKRVLATLAVGT